MKQRLPLIAPVRNLYACRNFDRSLFQHYSRTHSFVENAIHDIDLILWYVDSPVKRAHGFCRKTLGLPNPDINWGVLEFENGAIAVLQTTWLYPPQKQENLQWNAGIQIMGDRGVLEVRNDSDGFRANTEETGIVLLDQTGWAELHGEARGAFGAMLRHFLACLRGETAYAGATPQEALEAMRVACRLIADSEREERQL
jgi:predicted dehydrogenase